MRPSLITSIGLCLLREGFQPQAAMNCCDEIFKFIYKENYYKTESKNENTSHMQQKHKGDAYIPSTNNHVHKSIKN
jgi:hypothetical protein